MRYSATGIAFIAIAVAFMIGGVAAGVGYERACNRPAREQRLLKEQGKDAEGRITSAYHSPGAERAELNYRFEIDGRPFFGGREIPLAAWEKLTAGSHLIVRYLPSDPVLNRPRDWHESAPVLPESVVVGAMLTGIGIGLLAFPLRERRLLLRGWTAPGVVTAIASGPHGKNYVWYEFALPNGALEKGHGGATFRVPTVGTPVWVIYDSGKPKRSSLYPMEKVRLVA